jgi:hypothetical protein
VNIAASHCSIAGFVREAGAYVKTTVPLEEFRWAELYRATIIAPHWDDEFDAAIRRGIEIAQGDVAVGPPGFIG